MNYTNTRPTASLLPNAPKRIEGRDKREGEAFSKRNEGNNEVAE